MEKRALTRLRRPCLRLFPLTLLLLAAVGGCERPDPDVVATPPAALIIIPPTPEITPFASGGLGAPALPLPPTPFIQPPIMPTFPVYAGTPTPDPTRPPPPSPAEQSYQTHTVSIGESLGYIAQLYGSTVEELMAINQLESSDLVYAGQALNVPGGTILVGPSFKLIPDSELVYGPAARDFDVRAFAMLYNGYLLRYQEEVEGQSLQGPQIVQLVANRYSVNPRLLLAALDFRSGWLTNSEPADDGYPLGYVRQFHEGLYRQLSWAANELNWGYYGRAEGGLTGFVLGGDGARLNFAPDVNDGTAGAQKWLSAHSSATYGRWLEEAGPSGFFATYSRLFGNPFAYTVDPLWPADLAQPDFRLPWADGETWYFTGGPHGGWAGGSAWAALDFVPFNEQLGCYPADDWVVAVAAGLVVRSDFGALVVDMDGDGYAGTGWAVTYMHLETRDRVPAGTSVQAGDRLGHPSCEGGFSNGTHVHISRTYNGRWLAADGQAPFVLGGWVSQGLGREYDGLMVNGEQSREACECREEHNAITAGGDATP